MGPHPESYHVRTFEKLGWINTTENGVENPSLLERTWAIQLYTQEFFFWMGMLGICNGLQVYKVHPWKHEALDLFRVLRNPTARNFLNPLIHICEINEDVIGRVSRLSWKKIEKWWSMSPNLPKATLGQQAPETSNIKCSLISLITRHVKIFKTPSLSKELRSVR